MKCRHQMGAVWESISLVILQAVSELLVFLAFSGRELLPALHTTLAIISAAHGTSLGRQCPILA